MANNENLIPIPGRLHSVATEGHVSGANEIFDDTLNKDQATINSEVNAALGTGGSVDSRIAAAINALDSEKSQTAGGDGLALSVTEVDGKITSISGSIEANTYDANGAAATAKTEVIGGATSSGNTLKKLEDRVSPLETAVGSGGSIDTRISNAVAAEAAARQSADTALGGRIDTLEDVVEDCAYIGEDDGTAVIANFDPQTDTVWKKAQTLSNADKAQVKTNLGLPQEIYSKTEVNELVSTPHQNYVTVATYSGLPASGSTDTIYRVSNYDGTQVATGVYSEYAWNGSDYIFLAAKSSVGEVFDISEYHAGTKYADLAAALGTNGANVPEGVRKEGMSVKFVQNSNNNYVQFRCIADEFTTSIAYWQQITDDKLLKIVGMATGALAIPGIQAGDVWYNTNSKLLRKLVSLEQNISITVPYLPGAVYTFNDDIYIWNGTDLVIKSTDYINKIAIEHFIEQNRVINIESLNFVETGSSIGSIDIPVTKGEVYAIKAGENKPTFYAILGTSPVVGEAADIVNGLYGYVNAGETKCITIPNDASILNIDIPSVGHANLEPPSSITVSKPSLNSIIDDANKSKEIYTKNDFIWSVGYKIGVDGSISTDNNCIMSSSLPLERGSNYVICGDSMNVDVHLYSSANVHITRIHNETSSNKYYIVNTENLYTNAAYLRIVLWQGSAATTPDNFSIKKIDTEKQKEQNAQALFSSFDVNQKQLDFKALKEYFSKWAKVEDILGTDAQSTWRSSMIARGNDIVWNPVDEKWYLFVTGFDGSHDRIGLMFSTDLINWTEYESNPIMVPSSDVSAPDYGGCSFPMIYRYNNKWYMYYIGFSASGYEGGTPTICLAESTDLINWTKLGTQIDASAFPAEYNVEVLYRASVFEINGKWYLVTNAGQYAGSEQIYCFEADAPVGSQWTFKKMLFEAGSYSAWPFLSDPNVIRIGNIIVIITWADDGILLWFSFADEFPNGEWNCYKMTGLPANTRGNAGISRITKVDGPNGEVYFLSATKAKTFLTLYQRI